MLKAGCASLSRPTGYGLTRIREVRSVNHHYSQGTDFPILIGHIPYIFKNYLIFEF